MRSTLVWSSDIGGAGSGRLGELRHDLARSRRNGRPKSRRQTKMRERICWRASDAQFGGASGRLLLQGGFTRSRRRGPRASAKAANARRRPLDAWRRRHYSVGNWEASVARRLFFAHGGAFRVPPWGRRMLAGAPWALGGAVSILLESGRLLLQGASRAPPRGLIP